MKEGVLLVNCARGEIVHEEDLIKALDQGKVAGYGADVFQEEPLSPDHAFRIHAKVVCTPHLGASTIQAQDNIGQAVIDQLKTFFDQDYAINGVNVPAIDRSKLKQYGPWIILGEKLGALVTSNFGERAIEEIQVEYTGVDLYGLDVAPVQLSILKAVLGQACSESVNFVNAQLIAKQRGIKIHYQKQQSGESYPNSIRVAIKTKDETCFAIGTTIGGRSRVLNFDGYQSEFDPNGHLLIVENLDKPGTAGQWATILGKANINISNMHLAIKPNETLARSIINIDQNVSNDVLQEIEKLEYVKKVYQINLGETEA